MRSAALIFVLLLAAFVQGLNKIDAHAANAARATIDQAVQTQR